MKIKIPEDSYELDVGIPPLVVVVKSEEKLPASIAPESAGSDPDLPNSGTADTLVDLSSSTCADLVTLTKNSSEYTDTAVKKDAYIHDFKVLEDDIVASDCTVDVLASAFCDSSPLPPSSPIIWPSSSPPPVSRIASPEVDRDLKKESTVPGSDCTLVLDHDSSASTDDWKRVDLGTRMI